MLEYTNAGLAREPVDTLGSMSRFKDAADRVAVERRLLRYVGINSVNPAFEDGPGEAALANVLFDDLAALGVEPTRPAVHGGGRDNIVATLPGATDSPTVMYHAHLDTVGLSGKATADPVVSGGMVYGRGSCDTKGSLAAMVESIPLLLAVDAAERATILFVGGIDEEVTGTGALALTEGPWTIDMAIVGEPTGLEMATAHKGVFRVDITTVGTPAHSSKPHLGVNAISAMATVVHALESDYIPSLAERSHALVGSPTFNVSTIRGGTGANVVPAECVVHVDRRVIPGETHSAIMEEIEAVVASCDLGGARAHVSAPALASHAVDTPGDHPVVQALGAAREAVVGEFGSPIGVTYGTDASFFDPAGIPCVIFGPGSIDQAHADEEWVSIEETARAAEILAQAALNLAG